MATAFEREKESNQKNPLTHALTHTHLYDSLTAILSFFSYAYVSVCISFCLVPFIIFVTHWTVCRTDTFSKIHSKREREQKQIIVCSVHNRKKNEKKTCVAHLVTVSEDISFFFPHLWMLFFPYDSTAKWTSKKKSILCEQDDTIVIA